MVLLHKWPFFQRFYLGNIGQENIFYDLLERKIAFLGYKIKKFKSRKIDIFPKGLTHGFSPKMAIFSTFFGNIGQENVFYDILQRKNAFLGYKNKKFKKSRKRHFSKGVNPWFWSNNGHFSNFFFFTQYRLGKCLLRYSRAENGLSRLKKTRSSKSRKLDIFPKGLTQGFGPKMAIFPTFIF